MKKEKNNTLIGQGSNTDHLNVKSSPRLLCQVAKLILIKFCQYMLSEAGRAVFIKDSKINSKKLRRVLTVKALLYLILSHLKKIL